MEIKSDFRQLSDHEINELNSGLRISVLDKPGQGGACHEYSIFWVGEPDQDGDCLGAQLCSVKFQNGPIAEVGVNGISQEALIAICIDRLRGFQSGEYACEDNNQAKLALEHALRMLQKRTRERLNRGVEGTSQK